MSDGMSGICSASPMSDKWCPYAVHGAVPCQSTATSRKTAKCQGRARIFLWGKIEGPRAESRVGFLGRGAATPSPPAGGSGEHCELPVPQLGLGWSPDRPKIFHYFQHSGRPLLAL